MEQPRTFTGYQRSRTTRRSVRIGESASRLLIGIGGIGTIVAVSLVMVFLISVVVPLFRGESLETASGGDRGLVSAAGGAVTDTAPDFLLVDEHQVIGVAAFEGASRVRTFRPDTGEGLEEHTLFGGRVPAAWALDHREGWLIAGFQDGFTRIARLGFLTDFLEEEDAPDSLRDLEEGVLAEDRGGIAERTPVGQLRIQRFHFEEDEPVAVFDGSGVALVDIEVLSSGPVVAAMADDGTLTINQVSRRRNLLTGVVTITLSGGAIAVPQVGLRGLPAYLYLTGVGDNVYLIWPDGLLIRYDTRNLEAPQEAEQVRLLPAGSGLEVTAIEFMIGRTTMVVGDSGGNVRTWFRVKPEQPGTVDGAVLVNSHAFTGADSPVTAIAVSRRKRLVAAGHASGEVRLYHVTSDQQLSRITSRVPVARLALAPKDDGLYVLGAGGAMGRYRIHAPHPEATLQALFTPVWYEGNVGPGHVWQSSSGTDHFEPKYGLIPLIFGTLKATFYSLLFGVPIALLAAIYTSEFLHPRIKARIKPMIEMMASLPSVVLGFLAALVVAPFVENVVPAVLMSFVLVPLLFLLGAYLMQLLPRELDVRLRRFRVAIIALVVLPAGVLLAAVLGPAFEGLMFYGNLKLWLDGQVGDGGPGWVLLLLPLSGVAVIYLITRAVNPRLRTLSERLSRRQAALLELGKYLGGLAAVVLAAWLGSRLLVLIGWDSRIGFPLIGPVFGTYIQRNSLVVGFIMGFAIIPIIYTLADDALASVPEHLRSASLASGATPWQTTIRVIVPTAMSGLFSAVMIGLGRAVGETMIVLMAAGNTPVLEWNIFNGFRTLSANIAVELPEAVANSTHYRILFLAALVLFAMTFVVNTVAELVRLRFRKRAFEL